MEYHSLLVASSSLQPKVAAAVAPMRLQLEKVLQLVEVGSRCSCMSTMRLQLEEVLQLIEVEESLQLYVSNEVATSGGAAT